MSREYFIDEMYHDASSRMVAVIKNAYNPRWRVEVVTDDDQECEHKAEQITDFLNNRES